MPLKDKEKRKAYSKAYNKKYRSVKREKIKTRKKAYYLANKERISKKGKIDRLANPEKVKANKKAYYLRHTAEIKAKSKAYQQAHPEVGRLHGRKRKALKRGVQHKPYATNYVFERDNWICQLCGQRINRRLKYPNPRSGSIDHIVPLSKGGDDSPMNVQATHLRCNVGKHAINKGQLRLFG